MRGLGGESSPSAHLAAFERVLDRLRTRIGCSAASASPAPEIESERIMRIALIGIIALATLATTMGCEDKSSDKGSGASSAVAAPGSKHAPVGVRPGSHADWCGEHQVPESMCTRCNPSLIAAFKATGDWCVEHNLPESQCLICNPDLKIERPPPTGAKP